jgi:hypothetical protein
VTTRKRRLRAEACLAAAKDEGIAREDIEEETGDLANYMGAAIANLVNHPDRGAASMDDNREQLIRTKAFYIWLDEGCPEGRADAHWQMATELAAAEGGRRRSGGPVRQQPNHAESGADPNAIKRGKRREKQGVGRPLAFPCARQRRQSHSEKAASAWAKSGSRRQGAQYHSGDSTSS